MKVAIDSDRLFRGGHDRDADRERAAIESEKAFSLPSSFQPATDIGQSWKCRRHHRLVGKRSQRLATLHTKDRSLWMLFVSTFNAFHTSGLTRRVTPLTLDPAGSSSV